MATDPFAKWANPKADSTADPFAKWATPKAKDDQSVTPMSSAPEDIAHSWLAKMGAQMGGAMAGGFAGGQAGLALGTMTAPLTGPVGPAAGMILGGMLGAGAGAGGAEALRQKIAAEPTDPSAIRNTAILSGLLEPVGMALGPGIKGIKALGGGSGVAAAGRTFLQGINHEVESHILGSAAQKAEQATQNAAAAHRGIMEDAVSKSSQLAEHANSRAQQIVQGTQQAMQTAAQKADLAHQSLQANFARRANDLLGDAVTKAETQFPGTSAKVAQGATLKDTQNAIGQLTQQHHQMIDAADQTGASARPVDLLQHVISRVDQAFDAASPMGKQLMQRVQQFYKTLEQSAGGTALPPSRVLRIKQAAQDASDALWRQQNSRQAAGQMGKRVMGMTADQAYHSALAKGAQDWLEKNIPGEADLNGEMRSWMGTQQVLKKSGARLTRLSEAAAEKASGNAAQLEAGNAARQTAATTRLQELAKKHEAAQAAIKQGMGQQLAQNYEKLAGAHGAAQAGAEKEIAASRLAKSTANKQGLAKTAAMAGTLAAPIPWWAHGLGLGVGFGAGPLIEPLTSAGLRLGVGGLDNPLVQQLLLRQAPRGAGLAVQNATNQGGQ